VHENGLNSLRLSTHIYNNKTEIDKLIALVKDS
jgi:selenocysteine lyase/cysteine desulfurase